MEFSVFHQALKNGESLGLPHMRVDELGKGRFRVDA